MVEEEGVMWWKRRELCGGREGSNVVEEKRVMWWKRRE